MGRIVHRRRLPSARTPSGIRRLPIVGRAFLLIAVVVAAGELWPAINAAMLGVTDLVGQFADVLPTTLRNAAIVAMPAAVLWARPRVRRTNPWLWKGVLIVATIQLARYPAEFVQTRLLETQGTAGVDDQLLFLTVNGISLILAFLSALGVWAVTEGLKDAGARLSNAVVAVLAVGVAAVVIVVFGGPAYEEIRAGMSLQLAMALVSVLANAVFLFALALLAARGSVGAIRRLEPPAGWRVGALAAIALVASPLLSLAGTLAQQLSPGALDFAIFQTVMRVLAIVGWPLFAVALSMGMGAWPVRRPGAARRTYVRTGPRFVPAAAPAD